MSSETKRRMLTIPEASKLIDGITEYRIRVMCKTGELRSFKAGNKYLISEHDLYETVLGKDFDITDTNDDDTFRDKETVKVCRRHNTSTNAQKQRKEVTVRTLRSRRKPDRM